MTTQKTIDLLHGNSALRSQSWLSDYVRGKGALANFTSSVTASPKSLADYGLARNVAAVDQFSATRSPTARALSSLIGSRTPDSVAMLASRMRPGYMDSDSLVGSAWKKSVADGIGRNNLVTGGDHPTRIRPLIGGTSKSLADYGVGNNALTSLLGPQSPNSMTALASRMKPGYIDPDSLVGVGRLSVPLGPAVEAFEVGDVNADGAAPMWPTMTPEHAAGESQADRLRALGLWLPDMAEVPRLALRFAATLVVIQQACLSDDGDGIGIVVVWACLAFLDLCAAIRKGIEDDGGA